MDQTQVGLGENAPLRLRIHPQFGKRELSSLPPELNSGIDLGGPEKIGLLGRLWRLGDHCCRTVHVVAADLVLRAIPAAQLSVFV